MTEQDRATTDLSASKAEAQRVRDFMEYSGRMVLQTAQELLNPEQLDLLRVGMRKIFIPFDKVMGFDGNVSPDKSAELFASVAELMQGAFLIGALTTRNVAAEKILRANQAEIARKKNGENAAERRQIMRCAILEAVGQDITKLANSSKCAEAIGGEVRKLVGIKSREKGFGDRSIQREIEAILEERGAG